MDSRHKELLTHMLGAGEHICKTKHGYRNYFCAEIGGSDYGTMIEMERIGLVVAGRKINLGRDQFFHATTEACEAIGLNREAIARAFSD